MVKYMQNREELRQKSFDRSKKKRTTCDERRKNFIFRREDRVNIVFGPKYRPLYFQNEIMWVKLLYFR